MPTTPRPRAKNRQCYANKGAKSVSCRIRDTFTYSHTKLFQQKVLFTLHLLGLTIGMIK